MSRATVLAALALSLATVVPSPAHAATITSPTYEVHRVVEVDTDTAVVTVVAHCPDQARTVDMLTYITQDGGSSAQARTSFYCSRNSAVIPIAIAGASRLTTGEAHVWLWWDSKCNDNGCSRKGGAYKIIVTDSNQLPSAP